MNPRPNNAPWRLLWQYVCLWDEDQNGLQPEANDEPGLLEDQDGEIDPEADGPENGDGEGLGEDETEDEIPIGDEGPGDDYGISEPEPSPPQIPGFLLLRNDNGSVDYLREFASWWDFATAAGDASLTAWRSENRTSQEIDRESWAGTRSFDEAMDMALRRGWPEGRELLRDSLVSVRPRPKVYESLEFEVAGAVPCVPVYCAGDPAWMISDPGASTRAAKPIVRIDYNHWVHSGVDIKSMMLRGAAIVSLADSLERQGLSVELRIIGNSKDFDSRATFRYSITYKQAGEPLDLDRAAFAIAHPASMRRLAFSILEQHKELERSMRGNYGVPLYEQNPSGDTRTLDSMTVLFIPGPRGRETPDSANAAVTKAASNLLNQLNERLAA
jgi:hypothetical protein